MSAISILSAFAMLGGSAFAVFSSSASNNGNTFGSGNLVLQINSAGGTSSTPVFTIPSAAPGDFFEQKLKLHNSGTVTASAVKLSSIALGGANTELASVLTLELFNDANDNGALDGGETVYGSGHLDDPAWTNFTLTGVTLPGGGTSNLAAKLTFDSGAGDTFQSKSMSFNFNLLASQ